jgi:hypothetical protein
MKDNVFVQYMLMLVVGTAIMFMGLLLVNALSGPPTGDSDSGDWRDDGVTCQSPGICY